MAGLEPPLPVIHAEGSPEDVPTDARTPATKGGVLGKWRRTVGLLMLAVVVFLWTTSNFLGSSILADETYSKPYFLTYVNTSFFILPLIPIFASKAYRHPGELRQWKDDSLGWMRGPRYRPLQPHKEDEGPEVDGGRLAVHARTDSMGASQELLLGDPIEASQALGAKDYLATSATPEKLSLHQTAKLGLEFCMLWFLANYFVAACLEYTTVASSTILTSTSSVFTLIFGSFFGVEKFTLRKLLGVLASLAGIILISSVDLSGENADKEHRGDFPAKSLREIAIGDALAFLSAVMYGLYSVFMKKRLGDETRVSMPVLFGLVGVINVCVLWPGFFVLHWTGIETFELPPSRHVTVIIVLNSLASLVSDLAWAYAVVLTTPIVVTVGLSLTIPLSLVGQVVLNSQTVGVVYWIGAMIVVLAFVVVNNEEKKEEEEEEVRMGAAEAPAEDAIPR